MTGVQTCALPISDGGWSQGHAEAFAKAVQTVGADKVQLFEKEGIVDTDAQATESAVRTMIEEQNCKLIFATSFGYMETVERLSKEFPDVKFEHCSGYISNENMDNYFGQIEQARYLSGIVAGMKTESNRIGYVAAQPIPTTLPTALRAAEPTLQDPTQIGRASCRERV